MRTLSRFLVIGVFLTLTIGAGDPVQLGTGTKENPFDLFAAETVSLCWDKVEGFEPRAAQVVCWLEGNDANPIIDVVIEKAAPPSGVTWVTEGAAEKVRIYELVKNIADGIYLLKARVQSAAGLWSPYAPAVYVKKSWVPVPAPGGCTILSR